MRLRNRLGDLLDPYGRIVSMIPALLLIAVASFQIYLARVAQIDPWKGGGFGMFSSHEGVNTRHIHIFVTTEGGDESAIDLPDDLDDAEYRLLVLPTAHRFEVFASELWGEIAEDHPSGRDLRVELWRTDHDVERLRPSLTLMKEFHFEVPRDAAP